MIGCHPYRDECFLWDRFPGYRCARPGANGFNASGVNVCATSKCVSEGLGGPAKSLAYAFGLLNQQPHSLGSFKQRNRGYRPNGSF